MNMDTITLKFQSVISKMKNDLSSVIGQYTKLDNTLNKVSNTMNKISSNSNMNNSFEKAKQQIKDVESQLKSLTNEYEAHSKAFSMRPAGMSYSLYNPDSNKLAGDIDPDKTIVINQDKLNEEKARIDELQAKINELKSSIGEPIKTPELVPKNLVPKTDEGTRKIKQIGNEAKNTGNKFNSTKSKARQMSNSFGNIGKSFKGIGNVFKDAGKSITKNMDKGLRSIKKFTLGLIGVRTVMSLLTKSVNAYLSFDTELQDSLNNSWNMLGSLLAPAIELVANLFATATNYIYRFVQALTGIDLVARANAKALESQAKATQKNAAAQRGLLAMDEITNLPTESGGSPAPQITVKDIDTKGMFSELIETFKKHDWHRAGEIIAEGINKGLKKIDWDTVRTKAERMGRNIAVFWNGVFELDWRLLGRSIANAVNTGIDFAYGFIHNFEWGRLGVGMGDALSEFFSTFDYNKLADSINEFVLGVYDMIKGFITHLDTDELSTKIVEFLERIKWGEIIEGLIEIIALWLRKTLKYYVGVFKNIISEFFNDLKPSMDNGGKEIGTSFGDRMKYAFKTALNKIIDLLNLLLFNFRGVIKFAGGVAGAKIKMDDIKIPHLATGTNDIKSEGLYHLHEGEAVVPKKYNPVTGGYDNSVDNRQIIDLLISLNSNIIEYANRPIDVNVSGKKIAEATYDDLQTITRNRNSSNVVTRS